MRICIDPGHSGPYEPGACAAGVTEAAINMEIAMWLAIYLREAGQEVLLTREGDIESDSLSERCRMANEWEADIFSNYYKTVNGNPFYRCLVAAWEQCIPYEGNESLLGTTGEPSN